MVLGKWFTDQMWDRYINKNHPLSYLSLINALILHHDMSYDPTLRHVDHDRKVNDEGFYQKN